FATSHGLGVGSTLTLEGEPYQVVGVLQRTLTAPDRFVMVAIEDARRQWVAKDRMLRTIMASGAAGANAADLNTGAGVGWRGGEALRRRARRGGGHAAGRLRRSVGRAQRPAALPLLGPAALRQPSVLSAARRGGSGLRHAARVADLASRGDPPRCLRRAAW